jgi:3',5'-cyclic AMP phosphodiesterase CpdA
MRHIRAIITTIILVVVFNNISIADDVRLGPYLQNIQPTSVIIRWQTTTPVRGRLVVTESKDTVFDRVNPDPATQHRVVIDGLKPDTSYAYRVGTNDFLGRMFRFKTAPGPDATIRFVVMADPQFDASSGAKEYTPLLRQIQKADPDLLLIAGDLVERGGSDADWALFWKTMTDGDNGHLAQNIPIYPCLGNHEYYYGGRQGYQQPYSEQAVSKYLGFFDLPDNGAADPDHRGRYYSFRYGPAAFIVLDTCNDDSAPEYDTSTLITGGKSPGFHPGSGQYQWLESKLAKAQQEAVFTFVMFHHSPYSAGVHGNPNERQSSYPTRVLDDLFHKYGVAAVFNGHDHINQRSHTVRNGRELPYLTTTMTKPRGRIPNHHNWLIDPASGRLFLQRLDDRNQAFTAVDLTREGESGDWVAVCRVITLRGFEIDRIVIRLTQLKPGGRLSPPQITSCGKNRAFVALFVTAILLAFLTGVIWQARTQSNAADRASASKKKDSRPGV